MGGLSTDMAEFSLWCSHHRGPLLLAFYATLHYPALIQRTDGIVGLIYSCVNALTDKIRYKYNVNITSVRISFMKLNLRPKAINLRKNGFSIKDIAKKLDISTSTASIWCRKTNLTSKQKKKLEIRKSRKLDKFLKMVQKQKLGRLKANNKIQGKAYKEIGNFSKRDLLIAGVALYWAEGFKHLAEKRIGFCNSDPAMIKFMINFLTSHFEVKTEEISPRLTINKSFKDREGDIIKFWSDYLKIPESQFTKSFYQKVKLVKVYEHPENYHGVLRIHVKKSSKLLLKMRGNIEGFKVYLFKN